MLHAHADTSIIMRLKLAHQPGVLADVMKAIVDVGAQVGAIDIIRADAEGMIRDLTIYTQNQEQVGVLQHVLSNAPHVTLMRISDRTFLMHLGGKIEVNSRIPIRNRDQLSRAYTPGVARVCMAIHEKPSDAYNLTMKRNMVAVVTDGSAVLGLGNIGPAAALPVMEGKAALFRDFAGVNAFPLCLDTQDTDQLIETVCHLAPGFGGINLEDISAPRCFEIEKRLQERLDIPVFHDDQHGTAIVLSAAMLNALKLTHRKPGDLKVVINGVGAAGIACAHMLKVLGVDHIIGCDRQGAIFEGREHLNAVKAEFASWSNPEKLSGTLEEVIQGADVFVGLSAPNRLSLEMLKSMAENRIVFAMANPTPEIAPELAYPHVAIMATGRSDYPNQINNVLAFPGLFKGALEAGATCVTDSMKLAAAYALAKVIPDEALSKDYIIPSVFDEAVVPAVSQAVANAAMAAGVVRERHEGELLVD